MAPEVFVRRVRDGLGTVMAADMASVVVFEALEKDPSEALPTSRPEFAAFLSQFIQPSLEERLGERSSQIAMLSIEKAVSAAVKSRVDDVKTTVRREAIRGPVGVLVLSSRTTLGIRMRAALGGERVGVAVATSLERAIVVSGRLMPQMLILDLDFIRDSSYEDVASFVRTLQDEVSIVVWGESHDAGSKMQVLLKAQAQHAVLLGPRVGLEPLLDLIRSRGV